MGFNSGLKGLNKLLHYRCNAFGCEAVLTAQEVRSIYTQYLSLSDNMASSRKDRIEILNLDVSQQN